VRKRYEDHTREDDERPRAAPRPATQRRGPPPPWGARGAAGSENLVRIWGAVAVTPKVEPRSTTERNQVSGHHPRTCRASSLESSSKMASRVRPRLIHDFTFRSAHGAGREISGTVKPAASCRMTARPVVPGHGAKRVREPDGVDLRHLPGRSPGSSTSGCERFRQSLIAWFTITRLIHASGFSSGRTRLHRTQARPKASCTRSSAAAVLPVIAYAWPIIRGEMRRYSASNSCSSSSRTTRPASVRPSVAAATQ